jgi:hypothetical protein
MHCARCERTQCGYAVSYTEGSQIRGEVMTDHVHFGDGASSFTERMVVGCQTYETGLFRGQVADGMCARRLRAGASDRLVPMQQFDPLLASRPDPILLSPVPPTQSHPAR